MDFFLSPIVIVIGYLLVGWLCFLLQQLRRDVYTTDINLIGWLVAWLLFGLIAAIYFIERVTTDFAWKFK